MNFNDLYSFNKSLIQQQQKRKIYNQKRSISLGLIFSVPQTSTIQDDKILTTRQISIPKKPNLHDNIFLDQYRKQLRKTIYNNTQDMRKTKNHFISFRGKSQSTYKNKELILIPSLKCVNKAYKFRSISPPVQTINYINKSKIKQSSSFMIPERMQMQIDKLPVIQHVQSKRPIKNNVQSIPIRNFNSIKDRTNLSVQIQKGMINIKPWETIEDIQF